VSALTLQTAAQAESLSTTKLALATSEAERDAERLSRERAPADYAGPAVGDKGGLRAALAASRRRVAVLESALAEAQSSADECTRAASRLEARLGVAEAEAGLLSAERALAAAEAEAEIEKGSGNAGEAVRAARAALTESRSRAEAAARRGGARAARPALPRRRRRATAIGSAVFRAVRRLLWRLRYLFGLLLLAAVAAHVASDTESVGGGEAGPAWRPAGGLEGAAPAELRLRTR
jgi:hypothetical protein